MEGYLHNFKEIEKGRGPSPLNPMECGFSCMRTCSMSVISSSYFLLSAITDRFNARNLLQGNRHCPSILRLVGGASSLLCGAVTIGPIYSFATTRLSSHTIWV
jgi:hypothetical protein